MLLPLRVQFHSAGAEAFAILRDVLFPLLSMLTHQIGVEQLAADLDRMGRAVGEEQLEADQIVLSRNVENRDFVELVFMDAQYRGRLRHRCYGRCRGRGSGQALVARFEKNFAQFEGAVGGDVREVALKAAA